MSVSIFKTKKLFFLWMCVVCTLFVTFVYATIFTTTKGNNNKEPPHDIITIPPVITSTQNVQFFQKLITNEEMAIYKVLVKKFIEVVPKNATYFLMYGSLLGAYRHHGIIPWDADVDLLIKASDRPFVNTVFKSLTSGNSSEFGFVNFEDYIWRFYHHSSAPITHNLKWPYLDIFFYKENSTHIWEVLKPSMKFAKTLIFPLRKRPFMGYLLPAPKQTRLLLEKMYNLNVCKWTFYKIISRHSSKKSSTYREMRCDMLMDRYPFVKRQDNGSGTIETLEVNGAPVANHTPFFIEHGLI